MEKVLILKDQEDKLKSDMKEQKARLRAKISVAHDLERQARERELRHLEDRYLNKKEFGINKGLLKEMTRREVQEHQQEVVIEKADPKSFLM
jgi:hypothetical protein